MENTRTFKTYSVSLNFWNNYFKDFLDELNLTYTQKVEQNPIDTIFTQVKVSVTEDEAKKIMQFIKFPSTKKQREAK